MTTEGAQLFLIIILATGLAMFSCDAFGDADTEQDTVETMILHLTRSAPNHRVRKQPALSRMAKAIRSAADSNGLDPALIAVVISCESSFLPKSVGRSHGELGLMQVHGSAAEGCELDTIEGQIQCGSIWLRRCQYKCDGSDKQTLMAYGTGRCVSKSKKVNSKIVYRLNLYRKLNTLFR